MKSAICSVFLFLLLVSSSAWAACTGSSPTWTSTPDESSVQTCVNNAVTGDTINVSGGSATWTANIIVNGKDLTILGSLPADLNTIGAGSNPPSITGGTIGLVQSASRVAGFQFNVGTGTQIPITYSQGFRYDHNTIPGTEWHICWYLIGSISGRTSVGNEGVIDHNLVTDCRYTYYGEDSSTGGSDRWLTTTAEGTTHGVFLEDNDYTIGGCYQEPGYPNCTTDCGVLCNFADANYGGNYIARFNRLHDTYFEGHPTSGTSRGARFVEVYGNHLSIDLARRRTGYAHVGIYYTGRFIYFDNVSDHDYSLSDTPNRIDLSWHDGDNRGAMGACDGTNYVDSNELVNGWLCRDQPGAGADASYWQFPTNPAPTQTKAPGYVWNNSFPLGEIQVNKTDAQLAPERDYYVYTASFNGTTGVGRGTLASRPITCTKGVAYWVTDQGKWRTDTPSTTPDGRLDICMATNAWTAGAYIPWCYPHPLISGIACSQSSTVNSTTWSRPSVESRPPSPFRFPATSRPPVGSRPAIQ